MPDAILISISDTPGRLDFNLDAEFGKESVRFCSRADAERILTDGGLDDRPDVKALIQAALDADPNLGVA